VLADGRVIDTGRRTVKGVAGYDLTALFVGSEGTLGVVTAATVRLRPRPAPPTTILGSFDTMRAAAEAVAAVVRAGVGPSLLELVDRATLRAIAEWKSMALDGDPAAVLIAQTDGPDAAAAAEAVRGHFLDAGAEFAAVSDDAAEASQLLEIRRLAYPAAERLGQCLVEDVGVPRSRLPELIEEIERAAQTHDVRIMTVAHAGDGNVHPTFVFDRRADGEAPPEVWAAADDVFRAALQLGGTLTGEHGIGALKQRWLGLELGNDVLDLPPCGEGRVRSARRPQPGTRVLKHAASRRAGTGAAAPAPAAPRRPRARPLGHRRRPAGRGLPPLARRCAGYVEGGADAEITLAHNRAAFDGTASSVGAARRREGRPVDGDPRRPVRAAGGARPDRLHADDAP